YEERRDEFLEFDEMLRVVRVLAKAGLYKVRITGGEPLVRKGVVDFIGQVARVPGITDLALSTNGLLLDKYARALARNRLKRVNVSLDTLDHDMIRLMTGAGVWKSCCEASTPQRRRVFGRSNSTPSSLAASMTTKWKNWRRSPSTNLG